VLEHLEREDRVVRLGKVVLRDVGHDVRLLVRVDVERRDVYALRA
jgi:hypothetical protein